MSHREPRHNLPARLTSFVGREREVGEVRQLLGEARLVTLEAYVAYYNRARPHQGLDQRTPVAPDRACGSGPIRWRDMLGGLLHDYYREAA